MDDADVPLSVLAGLLLTFPVAPSFATAHPAVPIRFPLTTQAGLPTVQATVDGRTVSLFLDVGAYPVLGLKTAVLKRVPVTPFSRHRVLARRR